MLEAPGAQHPHFCEDARPEGPFRVQWGPMVQGAEAWRLVHWAGWALHTQPDPCRRLLRAAGVGLPDGRRSVSEC